MTRTAPHRSAAVILALALALLVALSPLPAAPEAAAGTPAGGPGLTAPPEPVDPQSWVRQEDMTWDDYRPIPGFDWTDESHQPPRKIRAALILGDFQDQDFVVTLPEGSDLAGNPRGVGGIPREEVAAYYESFLNEPNALNYGHSVNEFWLEDSYGLIGVDMDAFGPYRMDGKEHEYGLGGGDAGGGGESCPEGDSCGRNFDSELVAKSAADVNAASATSGRDYDFRYLLHAGYDESGTWQEFGEMMFPSREEVTDPFGNPDQSQPNWVETRYIDWTSFWAGTGIWSHALPGALSTQGESDGQSTFAHELSHILGVLDNYNNPYGEPVSRSYTGPWAQLSRGTFNGPGGPHMRWLIPANQGGALGSHHMLRNKLRLGFLRPSEVMFLERDALAETGPVFADIWAREVPLGPGRGREGLHGVQIVMPTDNRESCSTREDYRCDRGNYNNYTIEVVDRMGTDSFTPDHGVLIARTKNADTPPFMWAIDAHPEDINLIDFVRPDGSVAMVSLGDMRQLNDALFHAGTGRGVVHEYVDEANRLHFYVLEKRRDDEGVLSYRVAVRSLDGAGVADAMDVALTGNQPAAPGRVAVCTFDVTAAGSGNELVRLAADTDQGWETTLAYEVVEAPGGEAVTVPVYVRVPAAAGDEASTVTLTATSETDDEVTQSQSCEVEPVVPDESGEPGDPGDPGEPGEPEDEVRRVDGTSRLATALNLSREAFDAADVAVLARDDDYPDALAAAGLAAEVDAPVLLTPTGRLNEEVAGELERLGVGEVYLMGGTAALSRQIEVDLDELNIDHTRVGGAERFETAALIADEIVRVGGAVDQAVVALGARGDGRDAWPDALAAGNLAAAGRAPILLSRPGDLPEPTIAALERLLGEQDPVFIAGGTDAVGEEPERQLDDAGYDTRRLGGADRYGTAVAIATEARRQGGDVEPTILASGEIFPDALVAAPAARRFGGMMLLTGADELPDSVSDFLTADAATIDTVLVAGGTSRISDAVADEARRAIADP